VENLELSQEVQRSQQHALVISNFQAIWQCAGFKEIYGLIGSTEKHWIEGIGHRV
jgi:hypothetical protein